MPNTTLGSWTPYSASISADAQKVFNDVTSVIMGVKYSALAVATQVVSGINYSFFCNAKGVYPGATNDAALVKIYAPASGTPHITEIRRVNQ
jgi:hypothetical protein